MTSGFGEFIVPTQYCLPTKFLPGNSHQFRKTAKGIMKL